MPVGTGRLLGLARAAAAVGPDDLYWAARATLISRREDVAAFDRAFASVFGLSARPEPLPQPVADRRQRVSAPSDLGASAPLDGASETSVSSPVETLGRKDFSGCSEDELAQIARLMARLRLRAPVRRTRRRRPARTGDPDLRRTLRRAMRTGGEPIERAWRRRRVQRRRLLLILDVSGSMSTYSRALALFAHASLRAGPGDWEAFAFGTRLTRMTRALSVADADVAISAAAAEVTDWDGGTRIGASLKRLIDEHGRTRVVRGATCVILSDGLDVGDPELLGEQMARLSRLAHRVVWLNPLKGHDAYEPLARGMAAALPHVRRLPPRPQPPEPGGRRRRDRPPLGGSAPGLALRAPAHPLGEARPGLDRVGGAHDVHPRGLVALEGRVGLLGVVDDARDDDRGGAVLQQVRALGQLAGGRRARGGRRSSTPRSGSWPARPRPPRRRSAGSRSRRASSTARRSPSGPSVTSGPSTE